MLWIYVLTFTVGVVAIVPTVLRAVDSHAPDLVTGFAGFVGFFGGVTGLLGRQAGVPGLATFIAAAAVGLAAGALHPEVLTKLRGGVIDAESSDYQLTNAGSGTSNHSVLPADGRSVGHGGVKHDGVKKKAEVTHDDT